nr:ribonuclease H-like domain-containing protein [Tanacetum cinerariifolium]
MAKERERKAKTTLLMALPEYHLAKLHKMADAKEMWEVIKSRFGGNDESKKMQKYLLKQQFKGFFVSASEGLHKGYDRFQTLLSQLEIHSAGVSPEDANQKILRSLPSSWSQVALIMRTKPGLDTLCFDEIDLKWQVAMISMRIKKFYKRIGRKLQFDTRDPVGFDKTKVECFNCHKIGHFARDCRARGNQDSRRRDAGYNGTKLETMVEDLHIRMIQKLWLLLM